MSEATAQTQERHTPQGSNQSKKEVPRLFCQLQVFSGCSHPESIQKVLQENRLDGVLYLDWHNPQGIAVLLMSENPDDLVGEARDVLSMSPFSDLHHQPELTMTGCTYPSGHESDLADWLLQRPRRVALNPQWPWAIWYPLRRKPEFALLGPSEQAAVLSEHAKLGRAYGEAGLASDIRLACYGLDRNDNEFVLGIVGPELTPLSCLIQDMRKTQQTSKYIQSMGPFFVGRVYWRSPLQTKHSA